MKFLSFSQHRQATAFPPTDLLIQQSHVPIEETLLRTLESGAIMASSKMLGSKPRGSHVWNLDSDGYRLCDHVFAFSGTIAAYEPPGTRFGNHVEYRDAISGSRYVFPVPDDYRGTKNAVLVAEHPDYVVMSEGNDRLIIASQVALIERFPPENGWFLADKSHDIPFGKPVEPTPKSRFLVRTKKMVGFTVRESPHNDISMQCCLPDPICGRGCCDCDADARVVHLEISPSYKCTHFGCLGGVALVHGEKEFDLNAPSNYRWPPRMIG